MTMKRAVTLMTCGVCVVGPASWAQTSADAELTFNTGIAHLREGRSQMALEEFEKAVKQDPKNPYFLKGLGQALMARRRFKDAVETFRKALALNPYYTDVRNDLGTALVLSGRREDGKREFLSALNDPMNPTPEVSARNLGQAFLEEKDYAQAFNWFQTSVQRNKAYPDGHLGVSDVLIAQGKMDETIVHLERAVQATSEEPSTVLALGQAYVRAGRFTDARNRFEQVLKKDPVGPAGRRAAEGLKELPK